MQYRKFVTGFLLFAVSLCLPLNNVIAQGKLSRTSKAAADSGTGKKKSKKKSSSSSSDHHHHHHHHHSSSYCDDDDSSDAALAGLFGLLFASGATSPWWLPHFALADDTSEQAGFMAIPYENGHKGGFDIAPFSQENVYDWQIRFLSDTGSDFSGLTRIGGQFQVDTSSRFGFETSFNKFMEELETADDNLWMGDANLTYRFAQNEAMVFHTGVGMNWMHDVGKTDVGYNLTYGFEMFPKKPFILRGSLDLGRIGDTSRVHYRGDVGMAWNRFEIFTGYDLERISNINLQTWTAGMQFRY